MNGNPIPEELEKVFNVGTGLSELDGKTLENLTDLIIDVDSLFARFSRRFARADLINDNPYDTEFMRRLINIMLAEEDFEYNEADPRYIFFLCFGYAMIASYHLWTIGVHENALKDEQRLLYYVYKTEQSSILIDSALTPRFKDLGIEDNLYLFMFYISKYVFEKFKAKYGASNN